LKILAVDTSTSIGSVALLHDSRLVAEHSVHSSKTHSERLLPAIDHVLAQTATQISDIDYFAVSHGPGSFTGLRIGIGTIKAIAFSEEKKTVGISSLEALALHGAAYTGAVCALMNAGQGEYYAGIYTFQDDRVCHLEDTLISPLVLSEVLKSVAQKTQQSLLIVSDIEIEMLELIKADDTRLLFAGGLPGRACNVGRLALREINNGGAISSAELNPRYIRIPQAQLNLQKKQREYIIR